MISFTRRLILPDEKFYPTKHFTQRNILPNETFYPMKILTDEIKTDKVFSSLPFLLTNFVVRGGQIPMPHNEETISSFFFST